VSLLAGLALLEAQETRSELARVRQFRQLRSSVQNEGVSGPQHEDYLLTSYDISHQISDSVLVPQASNAVLRKLKLIAGSETLGKKVHKKEQ
jgi:hypothetical protein